MSTKASIVVCGAGYWGKNHIKNFRGLGALSAICDHRPEILAAYHQSDPNILTYARIDQALKNRAINAVVIALPTPLHYEFAKKALLAGKHVFVEKPLALQVSHARELCRLAVKMKKKLMVGHLLLYHPAVSKLKELIKSKELGDIYYLYAQRLNLGQIRKDENALWSLAPHDISIILELLGKPRAVQAQGLSYIQTQKGTEDVIFMHFHYEGGRVAHLHLSWLDPHKVRRITLVGSKKMVVFDDMELSEKIRVYDRGVDREKSLASDPQASSMILRVGQVHAPYLDNREPLFEECRHFIHCIEKNTEPHSDGKNGLDVIRLMHAATLSIRRGGKLVQL